MGMNPYTRLDDEARKQWNAPLWAGHESERERLISLCERMARDVWTSTPLGKVKMTDEVAVRQPPPLSAAELESRAMEADDELEAAVAMYSFAWKVLGAFALVAALGVGLFIVGLVTSFGMSALGGVIGTGGVIGMVRPRGSGESLTDRRLQVATAHTKAKQAWRRVERG